MSSPSYPLATYWQQAAKSFADASVRLVPIATTGCGQEISLRVYEAFQSAQPDKANFTLLQEAESERNLHLILPVAASGKSDSYYIILLHFPASFLASLPAALTQNHRILGNGKDVESQFVPGPQALHCLADLVKYAHPETLSQQLKLAECCLQLLRRALEAVEVPFEICAVPACRFLAHEAEREKIFKAQLFLDDNFHRQVSIKELARVAAMNECYLKKGFKALTGKTIYEYQHAHRIAEAEHLLRTGNSVTNVADSLGFSSLSHFSTAFKKATGIKPGELLK